MSTKDLKSAASQLPRAAADFVQLGATRDDLDPYLECARRREMRAVLVETPEYLRWRRAMGRYRFDVELGVDCPQDCDRVRTALTEAGVAPTLVLPGVEFYVDASFSLAATLRVTPWPRVGTAFRPLNKYGQRAALAHTAPHLPQPRFTLLDTEHPTTTEGGLDYPQVIKPVDAGAGLGILLVNDAEQRTRAQQRIKTLRRFGGGRFGAVLAEEYVKGPEVSLQGVAHQGRPLLLSVCEKLVSLKEPLWEPELLGFRDVGHIIRHGSHAEPELVELAQLCLRATGYQEGPFHMDAVRGEAGPVFLEMGFRLSGARVVSLVERATGAAWAEFVFRVHLEQEVPQLATAREHGGVVGQITATSVAELDAAATLARTGALVDVQPADPPVPDDAFTAHDLELLATDRMILTDFAGRAVITGDKLDEVRSLMQSLLIVHRLRD